MKKESLLIVLKSTGQAAKQAQAVWGSTKVYQEAERIQGKSG